jgi:HprK-related kinase A
LRVGDLTADAFAERLAGKGVAIRSGPFVTSIVSAIPEIAAPFRLLYADFPIVHDVFVDFHVRLRRATALHRWLRSQIVFTMDDEHVFHPFSRQLAVPLLEWGMNWCVYRNAHQYQILHAAVIEKDAKTVLLPGTTGAGKSTLCAALVTRGWRLLSDELAILRPGDGAALPIARPISLKNESIALIKAFAPDQEFGPVFAETRKGSMTHMKPPTESVHRMDEPSLPAYIVFPSYHSGAEAELDAVPKGQSFFRIADCSLNYHILGRDGFQGLADLIDACDCYQFRYSSLDDALRTFDTLT